MSNATRDKSAVIDSLGKMEFTQMARKAAAKDCSATMEADEENIIILTTQEVVTKLFQGKISYRRLLEFAKKGEIPCFRTGHVYLFAEVEVKKWLQKKLTSPAWMKSSRR